MDTKYHDIIRKRLASFIEDLEAPISFSKAVRNNHEEIRMVMNDGYKVAFIMECVSMKQSIRVFREALYQTNKRIKLQSTSSTKDTPTAQKSDKQSHKMQNSVALSKPTNNEIPPQKEDVIDKWKNANVSDKNLIRMLEKNSISVETVLSWNCANEFQLSRKITEHIISIKNKKTI
ncbi:hypothetical protein DZ860_20895 [Vibrio sinensis]|uniref:Uncharacterized protein n=1 Tax=Vibrio sinensis TaxID=2302434 RepID=A0A3A6QBQ6_9VIBR|nr:hypothetical protein [Vibrio sinensis]RJX65821.1 hypothetical protein DZ860_20895 [Vibrio sinensis]